MPEASITAHLPTMDIEFMRRSVPEQNAEVISIQIRATPSFAAMEPWLAPLPPIPFADAFQWWADMLRAAWQPWLAFNPSLAVLLPPQEPRTQAPGNHAR
ncbi:hypothetical protein LMG23992_03321 [Cupriavidus laharis]|uniref:Uncharacterized protein n=1 Tax=Cupriavidus laharis TaxID=151654 RepID=A0ABM8X9G0_9BURK|nr:hypothetical protein [Cupriavidus laharis]CAG9176601.1 hypothetical protein LMG23992_03321 [Cupriavidus laharis]